MLYTLRIRFKTGLKVVHRALMARNVLVGRDHHEIKVSGMDSLRDVFGTDEYVKTSKAKDNQIHIQWLAPECIQDLTFSGKSDIWSFGVLLWEVFSFGKAPFGAFKAAEISREIHAGRRLDRTDNCPPELFDEMSKCWLKEPMTRPTFADLQGSINLLLSIDGEVLRARVTAAKNVAASAGELSAYELPMRDWALVGEVHGTFGTIAGIVVREYVPAAAPTAAGNAANLNGASAGEGGASNANPPSRKLAVLAASHSSESVANQLRAAFAILKDVRNPNLLALAGCNSVQGFVVLFEKPMLGTLWHALEDDAIPRNERKRVALGIALGLEYLHAIDYVHGMLSSQAV